MEVNSLVSPRIESEWIIVLVVDLPVMGYHPEDQQTRNCVVVQLLRAELVTLPEVVVSFGIPRSTLRDARQRFEEQGVRGLVPAKSGPKGAWKLVTRARRLVLDTVYEHSDWKMPQVTTHVNQRLQEEGLAPLSEGHLRRFLTFCGILQRHGAVGPGAESSGLSVPTDGVTLLTDGSEGQVDLDEAGQYNFPLLITRGLAGLPQGYYTTVQVALTFFYLALFGIPTLETVKMLVKGEFGVLLGRWRSPGLIKLRSFLKAVGKLGCAEALVLVAACFQIQAGMVEWQILCIDGHFIPYYGGRRIRKGYFSTHRLALRGNEAYYANDLRGRPLFFLFTEASTSLIATLPEMVQQVKQIVGDRWVDWCLTLIFDRGGFCAKLFKTLDDLKVHWITWLKQGCSVLAPQGSQPPSPGASCDGKPSQRQYSIAWAAPGDGG